jgi:hypothetical protein
VLIHIALKQCRFCVLANEIPGVPQTIGSNCQPGFRKQKYLPCAIYATSTSIVTTFNHRQATQFFFMKFNMKDYLHLGPIHSFFLFVLFLFLCFSSSLLKHSA